jgi:hypothetical protein
VHRSNSEREGNLKLECRWCGHCRRPNKVILNWQRPLLEEDQEVVKRSGRDEPVWVVIHKCMEAMIGICLYSYLYLKLAKILCLPYYLLCFLFNKIGEMSRTGSAQKQQCEGQVGGVDLGGGGPNNVNTCK